jgi:hypothetical protein
MPGAGSASGDQRSLGSTEHLAPALREWEQRAGRRRDKRRRTGVRATSDSESLEIVEKKYFRFASERQPR